MSFTHNKTKIDIHALFDTRASSHNVMSHDTWCKMRKPKLEGGSSQANIIFYVFLKKKQNQLCTLKLSMIQDSLLVLAVR